MAYIVFFTITYLLCAEFITAEASKGEVLLFRRKNKMALELKKPQDEEFNAVNVAADVQCDFSSVHLGNIEKRGPVQKQTNIFHWKDVCYDVSIKGNMRRICDHIDGWVKPGTLTALMVC